MLAFHTFPSREKFRSDGHQKQIWVWYALRFVCASRNDLCAQILKWIGRLRCPSDPICTIPSQLQVFSHDVLKDAYNLLGIPRYWQKGYCLGSKSQLTRSHIWEPNMIVQARPLKQMGHIFKPAQLTRRRDKLSNVIKIELDIDPVIFQVNNLLVRPVSWLFQPLIFNGTEFINK